jgi:hypothetical protein
MATKLQVIKPKEYSNPEIRKDLYDAVDAVSNTKSPAIGYAFVSFHKDNSFRAYWNLDKASINPIDMPEMVKTRLTAKMIQTLKTE